MAEKMRDGIIKRGSLYYYVVTERGRFPAVDRQGKPKLDAAGNQIVRTSRQRWVKGAATRAATKALRDEARNAVHQGTYVTPKDLTVSAWLDQWMTAHEVELKPSTAKTYRDKIELYLKPTIGHEKVQALSPSLLSGVWRQMQAAGGKNGKPLSRRTVEFARAVLRKAMEDAVVERIVQVNPVVGSKMAKRDGKPQHTTWTGEQLKVFLARAAEDRWAPLWELAAGTGMRRGELMALRWDDVDLEGGLVSVERSVTQLGKERVATSPKNHERRKVAIDPHLVASLKAWKLRQAQERLAAGPAYVDAEGLLFTWEDGRAVLPDYVTRAFGKLQAAVSAALAEGGEPALPRLVVHELRHTHATLLLRDGVPVHIVAKRLGHKDPSVTLNVYADVIPDDDTSAVDVFSKAVWGA
ncbi:tyrosine-type recombinase/integrase [Nocardioides sp.]|uniref:tyrosine-type recombinase/integrase n=1 Tax=Nocardioides sp. TaxID=35761 RepID=UPI002BF65A59|nr:tyrosine-type recombinase/integrase [Nocardioides sp.]HSX66387.1 tyrosine-type recombinase/integrase [Nocardioides sp.]